MAIEIKVPEMGESVSEARILTWTKKEGDSVKQDEVLAELETDKVTLEIFAPSAGVLGPIVKKVGDTVRVKDVIGSIDPSGTPSSGSAPASQAQPASAPSSPATVSQSKTTSPNAINEELPPAVRKLIDDNRLNPKDISGTGRNGQITKEDVILFLEKRGSSSGVAASSQAPAPSPKIPEAVRTPVTRPGERETIVPMTKLRETIMTRLKGAQETAALLTTFNEVDMSGVMNLRNQYKEKFKETHGVGLGFMSFFTKAVIYALKTVPAINAEIRGNTIVYKNYYDIGVAVGGPKGLVVPIIRDADTLSLAGIEMEIARLANKVKEGKISLADMEGGTFTISNGGVYGSMLSTPIINPPQSGILGMHNIVERPVAINGKVEIRPIMYVALTYDHRIVDGKEAVTFLVKVKQIIEDPTRLLLEV